MTSLQRAMTAALLLFIAHTSTAGMMARWEVHLLDLQVVSCAAPTLDNVHLLSRRGTVSDAQALAALPPGRIVEARVVRSRVVDETYDARPAVVHAWTKEDGKNATSFFLLLAQPNGPEACDRLRAGSVVRLATTTASDCDTPGRMDLCLFPPLSILHELTEVERRYAAQ